MPYFEVDVVKVLRFRSKLRVQAKTADAARDQVIKDVTRIRVETDIQDARAWEIGEHVQVYFVEQVGP